MRSVVMRKVLTRAPRLALAAAAATALTAPLAAGSATAATARVVVVMQGLPRAFNASSFGCGSIPDGVQFVHVAGPGRPPSGKGSLQLQGPGITDVSLSGSRPAGQLTALSLYADSFHGTDPNFIVRLTLNSNATTADVLDLAAGPSGRWAKLSPLTATLELSHETLSNHDLTDVGPTTFADYLSNNPGSTLDSVDLLNTDCSVSGVGAVGLDDVTLGFSGGTPTTFNFEPDTHLSISIAAPATVVRGGEVTVHGFIVRGKQVFSGIPVELQASAAGTHGWVDADSLTSGWNAALHSEQFLNTTTRFRFVAAGSSEISPVTSKVVTVRVVPPPKKHHKKKHHRIHH